MSRRLALLVIAACGGGSDTPPGDPPLFPLDYAATYQEVRNCRFSLDHDLMQIRIVAAPDALTAYNNRTDAFPVGAVVLKEQYDGSDTDCTGPILTYTVMVKAVAGTGDLDWEWQEVDRDFKAVDQSITRCVQCHTDCGKPPEGYDGTCAVP